MDEYIPILPHVNASLNAVATLLLIAGFVLIKCGREKAHGRTMLACFCVSVFFLNIKSRHPEVTRFTCGG